MPIYQGTAKNRLISFTENDAPKKITDIFKGAIEQATKSINPLLSGISSIGARESFVGEGLQNEPAFHTNDNTVVNLKKSQKRSQLVQTPKTTVIVKKKQFDSLRNNYDMNYLDEQERLYLSAVKYLMRRKCDEIALYESLIDINSISESDGFLSVEQLLNSSIGGIANLVSLGLAGAIGLSNLSNSIFGSILDTSEPTVPENKILGFLTDLYNLKSRNDRSKGSSYTRWVEDETIANTSGLGPGVGTIELNLASRISTRVGIGSSDGGASLSIQDPYNLTVITDTDIEIAVRSALNQESGLLGLMTGSPSLKINSARALDLILTETLSPRKLPPVQFSFFDEEVQVEFGQQTLTGRISTTEGESLGFSPKETALVNSIVSQLRDYSASLKTISTVFDVISSDYKPLRERMRKDFLGHNIIQPMDTVTVFASSNTKDITPANTLLSNSSLSAFLSNGIDDISDRISDQFIEQERLDIAPSIPLFIYKALRNPDIYRDDGNCIFSGPVGNVSGSYSASSGEYTYEVSVDSNTKYLEISRYTETVDLASTFNSVEDPITPFDLEGMIDPVTGLFKSSGEGLKLTDENIRKLPYLRANKGPRAGSTIKNESDLNIDAGSKLTAQHVPGLTYQWKKGIVAATLTSGGPDELKGRTPDTVRLNSGAGGISAIKNPFAGLDPANIASILLTGQPYSYSSFLKSLKNSTNAGFSFDSKNSSRQFFNYLFDSIGRTSKYYGNFIPAKDSTVDRNTVIATYEAINRISALNDSLSSDSFKKQIFANAQAINSGDVASAELARTSIEEKINGVGASVATIRQALPSNVKVMLEGSEESVVFLEDESNNLDYLKYKVRRKPEDARYNRDNNYFLVASKYDSDVSIQASVLEQIGLNADLFRAEYKTPLDTIVSACNALQLEFFSDNNGNIVLKPPTYNKIPLSLFMLLQQNAASSGVNIMPSFVNGLIQSKKSIALELIYKNELEISQLIARSGKTPELQKVDFLRKKTGNEADDFYAPSKDAQLVIKVDDLLEDLKSMTDSFNSGERAKINLKSISKSSSELINQQDWLILILTEKARLDGINVYDQQEIQKIKSEAQEQLDLPQTQYTSRLFADLSAISACITKRRNLVRTLKDSLSKTSSTSTTSLETALYGLNSLVSPAGAANYPIVDLLKSNPLLSDIIVDDINNNEGPRSSKRFIINDDVIISFNLAHRSPSFTQVSVTGAISMVAPTGGTIGKIPVLQARATDFDMWRQYGARGRQTIHRPDMNNAETQLAPYAVLSLISERRKIHTMNITVVGNEYYVPGDTVYVNNRSMLYYVEQVSHDFDLTRGSFVTSLVLTHGRALGDFIPTPTDILGRQLLSLSSQASVRNVSRTNINSGNEGVTNLGSVIATNYSSMLANSSTDARNDDITQSLNAKVISFVEDNSLLIQSTVLRAATRYSSFDSKSNKKERVEVRAYFASSVSNSQALATSLANAVAERVKTQQNSQEGFISVLDLNVEVHIVDIEQDLSDEDKKYLRFPSEEAWKSPVQITPKFDFGNTQQKKMVSLPLNAIDIVYVSETIAAGTA